MYDTWAAYDDTAVGLYWPADLRQKKDAKADQQSAMSYAAYRCIAYLLPAARPALDAFLSALGCDPAAVNGTSPPAQVAAVATNAIIAVRSSDGSNQANNYADTTDYHPVNTPTQIIDPNLWQPLSIFNPKLGVNVTQKFTTPQWLNVTPFALTCGTEFLAPPADIYRYGSLGYVAQANELLAVSAALRDDTKVVVEYWADPTGSQTPPGHWTRIAEYISQRDNHTLDDDAKMFFAVTGALLDASITSWAQKRVYTSNRPITAIRYLYADNAVLAWGGPYQGTRIIRGGSWVPFQPPTTITPSFPSFTSAHSTFSAASAQVLRSFTGSDYAGLNATIPVGSSLVEPGLTPQTPITLSWQTFRQMAVEAGYSRILGGIHFHNDNIRGRQTGTAVGWQAWRKAEALFQGRAQPASTVCTHADFLRDFPFPQDDPLEDSLVMKAESEGLASTPTVAAPMQ
ncbi:hypothetical protein WJX81_000179 [Elliptochloris bilobata]|uniref:Phosphatidic acid phosphatase type 2/haloperoxidase domain-containing protein n=1 Tax=Elliptochloris bilobata TaxID=381761 RepID=A0AAW1QDB6_9CHLO